MHGIGVGSVIASVITICWEPRNLEFPDRCCHSGSWYLKMLNIPKFDNMHGNVASFFSFVSYGCNVENSGVLAMCNGQWDLLRNFSRVQPHLSQVKLCQQGVLNPNTVYTTVPYSDYSLAVLR